MHIFVVYVVSVMSAETRNVDVKESVECVDLSVL